MTSGYGEGEEVTRTDTEWNRYSGFYKSDKQGRLHPGGPDEGDSKAKDEVKLG